MISFVNSHRLKLREGFDMDRSTLSTKITGRHMPTKSKIVVNLRKSLSLDEVREVIEALKEFGSKGLSITWGKKERERELFVSKPDQDALNYLSSFGGKNYLLARVRAGDFTEHDSGVDHAVLTDGLHFIPKQRVERESVEKYFTEKWKKADGRNIDWKIYGREGEPLMTTWRKDYVVFGPNFWGAYTETSALGFSDLLQYFLQKVLEGSNNGVEAAASKGYVELFEIIGSGYLKTGVRNSLSRNDEETQILFLSTDINPYTSLVGLERKLYDALGKEVQLNYDPKLRNLKEREEERESIVGNLGGNKW